MNKMNQKEAVYQAVAAVIEDSGTTFEEGMDVATILTKEMRGQVNAILFEGFKKGKIELDKEFDDAGLKKYVSGLQSNWLRKDKRLNGNTKYAPQNPGSRFGSQDAELKALRALYNSVQTDAEKQEIQGFINERATKLKVTKSPTIDYSALPAELASKYAK